MTNNYPNSFYAPWSWRPYPRSCCCWPWHPELHLRSKQLHRCSCCRRCRGNTLQLQLCCIYLSPSPGHDPQCHITIRHARKQRSSGSSIARRLRSPFLHNPDDAILQSRHDGSENWPNSLCQKCHSSRTCRKSTGPTWNWKWKRAVVAVTGEGWCNRGAATGLQNQHCRWITACNMCRHAGHFPGSIRS